MKRILLATDLSARADRAFARASTLARQFGAALRLVFAVDEDAPDRLRGALEREAEAELRRFVDSARSNGVAAEASIVAGRAHAAILEAAHRSSCDLIVLGAHRQAAVGDWLVGSTVERVVRHAPQPVLVVRDRTEGPYERALVAFDFSPCAERALRSALVVAPQAEVVVVHAFETPFPAFLPREDYAAEMRREREAKLADAIGLAREAAPAARIATEVVEGEAGAAIRDVIGVQRPDLLALGTHARSGVAHALLGSTAAGFLRQPPCDLLTARA